MRLDPNPSFRKVIVPWYDSGSIYVAVIVLMIFAFLFSMAGVSLAISQDTCRPHIWLPVLLLFLSASVIVSLTLRLLKRAVLRFLR